VSTIVKGEGRASVLTPSGLSILFESKPRRHYIVTAGEEKERGDWEPIGPPKEVPSVSSVTDIFYKGGLDWWGMRVGISGVLSLIRRGEFALSPTEDDTGLTGAVIDSDGIWQYADMAKPGDEIANVEARLKEHKLRVDKIKDSAADRGTNVHDAMEAWAITGNLPNPRDFSPEEAPFVQGLLDFLVSSRIEPVRNECLVGSYEHGFAGRFDLECSQPFSGQKVVTRCDLKTPRLVEIPQGVGRIDLKTSSGVYFNNFIQIAGYELGAIESGYGESTWRGVLRVTKDGKYELRINPGGGRSITTGDFLRALDAYHLVKKCEEAIKV
jgi:hypothetical protein